ncbi:hypothetical protein GCM10027176_18720 [Actinoallomurus bryophytorum]
MGQGVWGLYAATYHRPKGLIISGAKYDDEQLLVLHIEPPSGAGDARWRLAGYPVREGLPPMSVVHRLRAMLTRAYNRFGWDWTSVDASAVAAQVSDRIWTAMDRPSLTRNK